MRISDWSSDWFSSMSMASSRAAAARIRRTTEAMERHHPQFPHAYLFTIGVRPAARGKGMGGKLFRPVLDACDRAGVPAYLENSNPDNTSFYRAQGFERVTMIQPDRKSTRLNSSH